ncbi:CYN59 [Auxenochlorella protothecoides x Auxenochlorella symbiontica]
MSVILETSKGDIVIDVFVDECPKAATNFLKLCKIKYYNNCLFYNVQRNFIAQTGDPTNTGKGGESVYGVLYGEQARFFEDEIRPALKHKKKGMVGMASVGPDANASQFYITTGEELQSLDEKHTIFGEVAEGWEVLEAIDDAPCDDEGRPLQNIRVRHTIVLDDPTPDPPALAVHVPDASPPPQFAEDGRLEDDWEPGEDARPAEEVERAGREAEAHNRAVVLEMIGDLPEADAKPPSNMLFICKLHPVTSEEDLETIFSRFGNITSCDIIRDWKTGDSLSYAFIGFDTEKACEEAYFKMNNVLIDDRRIKVDFSQSVHHLWRQFKRFGKKGNAELADAAAGHDRGGRDAGTSGRLELKEQFRGPTLSHGRGNREGYGLILDHYEDHGRPQGGARPLSPPRDSGRPGRMERREEQDRGPSRRHTRSRSREGRHGNRGSRSREEGHGNRGSRSREEGHGNRGSRSREEGHRCHDSRSRDGHSEHRERSDRRRESEQEGRRDRSGDRKRRGRSRSLGRSDPGEVETERRPHAHRHADRH